jgi:large subunit ribosomal protein L24
MPRTKNQQKKLHVRKGDMVRILTGNDKGKEGKILRVYRTTDRIIVEGVSVRIRHTKPNQLYPQGGRIEQEASIHISNVAPLDSNGDATRVGRKRIEDPETGKGHWARVAQTTGEELDS